MNFETQSSSYLYYYWWWRKRKKKCGNVLDYQLEKVSVIIPWEPVISLLTWPLCKKEETITAIKEYWTSGSEDLGLNLSSTIYMRYNVIPFIFASLFLFIQKRVWWYITEMLISIALIIPMKGLVNFETQYKCILRD